MEIQEMFIRFLLEELAESKRLSDEIKYYEELKRKEKEIKESITCHCSQCEGLKEL